MSEKTVFMLRKELKQAGFTLRIKTYSDFAAGEIYLNGKAVNNGAITKADYEAFKPAFDIIERYKGNIAHDGKRLVL